MNHEDKLWLSGILEGEGSFIGRLNGAGNPRAQVQAASNDLDVLERIQSIAGGKVYGPYKGKKPQHADWYKWFECKREAALAIMRELKPYMGKRRQLQITEAIAKAETPNRIECSFCGAEIMIGHMKRHMNKHKGEHNLIIPQDIQA